MAIKWKRLGRTVSLRIRLTLTFMATALLVWLAAGLTIWLESREQLDEFFDSYQLLLAHQLASSDWRGFRVEEAGRPGGLLARLEDEAEAAGRDEDEFIGQAEEEALSFAVFDQAGQLIFSDGARGCGFNYDREARGFVDRRAGRGRKWRQVWIKSPDGLATVVVGQRLDHRLKASLELVGQLLWPWLSAFLFLTGAVIWQVSRELKPLKKITGDLSQRAPDDLKPLATEALPTEVAPLGLALNQLFERLGKLLLRERAFVSDAAHELRTPLAALKVQAEVAQLAHDDPRALARALGNLDAGIERSSRLVEQLLALSRLESGELSSETEPLQWRLLMEEAVRQTESPKKQNLNCQIRRPPDLVIGRPLLIGLMLRNLLDNARRYSPEGANIDLVLDGPAMAIKNSGVRLSEEQLKRLGERFFRPPGQEASGSGLGLSIVSRVAELHGLELHFQNVPPDAFQVTLIKSKITA
ncbi:MAG: sensor histidine kinase N-terminal domain-containing protein, partial [Candidatus Adiutrix sp.]|nr:sensor histidine kinase N-terminal domain-containing protein [Candidatus Adiutrix sp.]